MTLKRRLATALCLLLTIAGALIGTAGSANATIADSAGLRALYNYDIPVTTGATVGGSPAPVYADPYFAMQALQSCFNCSFPVPGAPTAFPSYGQYIALQPCITLNSIGCQNAPVTAYPDVQARYFVLVAEAGHFDGQGSTVTFRFYQSSSGVLRLNVIAYVANATAPWWLPDDVNIAFAESTWRSFAVNLGTYITQHTCGSYSCPAPPTGAVVGPETWFNPHTGKPMDLRYMDPADGTAIQIWTWNDTNAQWWRRVDYGNTYYKIKNQATGKCIDIDGPSTANGAVAHEWDCYDTDSQLWSFQVTGRYKSGWPIYNLVNKYSGKCLDITGFGTSDGTPLQQWDCSGGWNQDWY
jgi:hypothetical protein